MSALNRSTAGGYERTASEYIPYAAQVSEFIVRTQSGDYLQVFRLGGASFESADDEQLNNWHERLNVLWRNLASPNVVVWVHLVRRQDCGPPQQACGAGFAHTLYSKYSGRLCLESLMVNELYLSVIYRPTVGLASGLAARLLMKTNPESVRGHGRESIESCEKLAQTLFAALARYEPQRLGTYLRRGIWHSSILEFLGSLINGESRPVPLPRGP